MPLKCGALLWCSYLVQFSCHPFVTESEYYDDRTPGEECSHSICVITHLITAMYCAWLEGGLY